MSIFSIGSSTPSEGFETKSCRFVDDSSSYLSRAMVYDAEGQRTWTYSCWVKRSEFGPISGNQTIFGMNYASNTTQQFQLQFDTVDRLRCSNASQDLRTTIKVFRDPAAWYHIVVQMNTRDDVAQNRLRFWINGEENTTWTGAAGSNGNITLSYEDQYGIGYQHTHYIGWGGLSSYYFDGYIAQAYFCSKELHGPELFGETNAVTGQWTPRDPDDIKADVRFGLNGFYLPFSDDALANDFKDRSRLPRTQPTFVATANSGAVTKTAEKEFGTASLYTNASSNQCVSIPDNAAFAFGEDGSDFTVECWFKWAGADADWSALGGQLSNDDNRFVFGVIPGGSATSGTLNFDWATGSYANRITLTTTTTVSTSDSDFHHYAIVREGNTWTAYLDGDREATVTDTRHNYNIGARWTIGKIDNGAANVFNGYIDEFRISHGGTDAARYSGASYTVPTAAFTPDDSTILLMHMDGSNDGTSFPDDASHTVTNTGGTIGRSTGHKISAVPTSGSEDQPWQMGPKVGPSVWHYTGDSSTGGLSFLETPDNTAWDYGSTDFTIEFWTTLHESNRVDGNGGALYSQYVDGNNHHQIYFDEGIVYWQIMNAGSHIIGGLAKSTVMADYNHWVHLAFVRNGNTFTIYKNGVAEDSADSSATIPNYSAVLRIGVQDPTRYFHGVVDEYRISNSARYTANFTPATEQFTKDANTLLLIHGDNDMGSSSFQDSSALESFNPTADISDVEYLIVGGGGAGGAGDGGGGGAGGYKTGTFSQLDNGTAYNVIVGQGGGATADHQSPAVGSLGNDGGNSTFNSVTAAGGGGGGGGQNSSLWKNVMGRQGGSGGGGGGHNASTPNTWGLAWPVTSPVQGYNGGEGSVGTDGKGGGGGGSNAAGDGSTTNNGAGGVGTSNDITGSAVTYAAGGDGDNDSNTGASGSNGTGDGGQGVDGGDQTSGAGGHGIVILTYQAASAQATGGQITTHGSGASQYYVHKFFYGSKAIKTVGALWQVQPKTGTGCGAINVDSSSTNTYLEFADSADFDWFGQPTAQGQKVTVECWFANTGRGGMQAFMGNKGGAENNYDLVIVLQTDGISVSGGGTSLLYWQPSSVKTPQANWVWRHMAYVYDSDARNVSTLYIDGVSVETDGRTMLAQTESGEDRMIGAHQDDGGYRWQWNGYMDEFRISRSVRYTANFTPTTTPFKDDRDTVFLCHMDGGGGIDPVTTFPTEAGAGSYWFDESVSSWGYTDGVSNIKSRISLQGSGNKLLVPNSDDWSYGTDPFTWEMWAKPLVVNRNTTMFTRMNSGDTNSTQRLTLTTAGAGYEYQAAVAESDGNYILSNKFLGNANPGVWAHLAVQRDGDKFQGFRDGTLMFSVTDTAGTQNNSQGLTFMNSTDNSYSAGMLFDGIRVSKGIARYDSSLGDTFTPTETISCNLLIVGGGGGGGWGAGSTGTGGGGGGAGGVRQITGESLTAQAYAVVVAAKSGQSTRGSDSVFASYTASGGGGGGDGGGGNAGETGGSGGGGGGQSGAGGAGNTPSTSPAQGFAGGAGGGPGHSGGGGGGAGEVGSAGVGDTTGGDGGDGISSSITGTALYYGGGGGGAARHSTNWGDGGAGGGGHGAYENSGAVGPPTPGKSNTGGGGGGGQTSTTDGRGGGSGCVIISYQSTTVKATGGTITTYGSGGSQYQVHTFDGNTKAFTPPSEPFTTDSYTKLLIQSGFSEGGLGADHSGNYNYYSPSSLSPYDMMQDSPSNNFATITPLWFRTGYVPTLAEGNLKVKANSGSSHSWHSTIGVESGKWYFEMFCASDIDYSTFGIADAGGKMDDLEQAPRRLYNDSGNKEAASGGGSYGLSWTTGDIMACAFDIDGGTISFYKNNVPQGVAFTNIASDLPNAGWTPAGTMAGNNETQILNFGQDSSFAGNATAQGNGGVGEDFYYTPPSGYKALCTDNLPAPNIADPGKHFNVLNWSGEVGNGARDFTGVGFKPDFVWGKSYNDTWSHSLNDSVRGVNKELYSNTTGPEVSSPNNGYIDSFDSDGFSTVVGSSNNGQWNGNGDDFVAWLWKGDNVAGGTLNEDGSSDSQVNVNTSAGFSIVSYTGTGAAATIGHGLSVAPDMVITKKRNGTDAWGVGNTNVGWTKYALLNSAVAWTTSTAYWNDTDPTASVFSVKDAGETNGTVDALYIAYCFHSVEGFSKLGSYTGNANDDGAFVYTGFRPAFIFLREYTAGDDFGIYDRTRPGYNATSGGNAVLYPAYDSAQNSGSTRAIDILSNGFKLRTSNATFNASATYIYYAIAETPFKTANAR